MTERMPTVVNSGAQAPQRLEGESFDAVLLDIRATGMDGIEVCRTIYGRRAGNDRLHHLCAPARVPAATGRMLRRDAHQAELLALGAVSL